MTCRNSQVSQLALNHRLEQAAVDIGLQLISSILSFVVYYVVISALWHLVQRKFTNDNRKATIDKRHLRTGQLKNDK